MGCAAADATWVQLTDFKDRYPTFQLEDELFRNEGGSVVDSFVGQTYQHRHKTIVSGSDTTAVSVSKVSDDAVAILDKYRDVRQYLTSTDRVWFGYNVFTYS